jgi:hypothetical protein
MGLRYDSQQTFPVFGTKLETSPFTRTPATLTAAYTGNAKEFKVAGFSKFDLAVLYTMGAAETANTIEVKFEHSPDGTNWYRIPNESNTNGVSTLYARNWTFTGTDAAAATISIGIDVFYKYLKVSVQETGVAANAGTIYAEGTLSGQ